jgi:phage terminase large subunit
VKIVEYKVGNCTVRFHGDSAEPKSIDELQTLGLRHISGAKKGKDSILNVWKRTA